MPTLKSNFLKSSGKQKVEIPNKNALSSGGKPLNNPSITPRKPSETQQLAASACRILLHHIAICHIMIADCYMTVGEKIRHLRLIEGRLRGLDRALTQNELVLGIKKELKKSISQPYLSQLESGRRQHLTNTTRLLLARFFKVHPGHLVDDPAGFQTELITDLAEREDKLDLWLIQGAELFRRDPQLAAALLKFASHKDTRHCLLVLARVLDTPELLERLSDVLPPENKQYELV
jgi:transcriptional regulator with XRE-family HTH domain